MTDKPQFNPHHTRDADYWSAEKQLARHEEEKAKRREAWQFYAFVAAIVLAAWDVAMVPGDVSLLSVVWVSLFVWVYSRD